jgi:hypothetical protein
MKTREDRQRGTISGELAGRYVPKKFTDLSRQRFLRDRRRRYLSRIPDGKPSDSQAALIQSLASLEFAALEAESRFTDMIAGREAREHRRLFQRLLSDFEKSLTALPAKRALTAADWLRGKDEALA